MSNSDSEISDDNGDIVSEEIRELAKNVTLNLLPEKSRKLYTVAYNSFKSWRKAKGSNSFCEDVLLAYIDHLSKTYAPTSLWSTYSMLKSTIKAYDNIDISRYNNLISFLKKSIKGHRSKKSKVFSKENITKFLNEAPDDVYLSVKVALIFGIAGALRREEFVNITCQDVRTLDDGVLLVQIPKTKNFVPRSFTIAEPLLHYCSKYMQARPETCQLNRFFRRYTNGHCVQQPIGINKFAAMPRDIAEYLNLPDAKEFSGHSFRRTSATLLVDAGADLTTLQRHGGWKSATVAFGYIADSINNKKRICNQISSGMNICKRTKVTSNVPDIVSEVNHGPSTSGIQSVPLKILEVNDQSDVVATSENPTSSTPKTNCAITAETHTSNQERSVLTSIENNTSGIAGKNSMMTKESCEVKSPESEEPKFSCFYHPDLGLCVRDLPGGSAYRQNCTFNNCNVTITGSNNTFIFNNCTIQEKSVEKENNNIV